VLEEVGAGSLPQIRVYNKIDRLEMAPHLERSGEGEANSVWISAARRQGLEELMSAVAERLSRFARPRTVRVDARHAGALRARLFASGVVQGERYLDDGGLELVANIPESEARELARSPGVEVADIVGLQPCAVEGGYIQSALSARPS
jgi:GTP-binding protein HflX